MRPRTKRARPRPRRTSLPPGRHPAPAAARGIVRNTAIFSVATGLSRIAGLVREVVAAYLSGPPASASAFTIAFQVPNLVRRLVADAALSAAFVPVFTEMMEQGNRKREAPSSRPLLGLIVVVLGGITGLVFILGAGVDHAALHRRGVHARTSSS